MRRARSEPTRERYALLHELPTLGAREQSVKLLREIVIRSAGRDLAE